MPIYEFNCKACGKDAEILVPTTDWKGTRCPSCESIRLTKKLSVFAVSAPSAPEPVCTGQPADCGACCGMGGCG